MTTNEKIVEILKSHPEGGEKFFNALDFMIRSDKTIIEDFLKFVFSEYKSMLMPSTNILDVGFVLTGQFGQVLMTNYAKELGAISKDIILVEGGLRNGTIPTIAKDKFNTKNFIVLDDSYYSGRTVEAINNALKLAGSSMITPKSYLLGAIVIYDGAKKDEKKHKVLSLFRYYE